MMEDGKITAEEAQRAKSAPLRLNVQSEPNSIAPYFVEEIRQYLEKKYGSDEVHEAGLRVYTSLNLEMQRAASTRVLDGLALRAPPRMEGQLAECGRERRLAGRHTTTLTGTVR